MLKQRWLLLIALLLPGSTVVAQSVHVKNRFESGMPDVDTSLLFAVPKSSANLSLQILGKQVGSVPKSQSVVAEVTKRNLLRDWQWDSRTN
jgi:hypothetical protein